MYLLIQQVYHPLKPEVNLCGQSVCNICFDSQSWPSSPLPVVSDAQLTASMGSYRAAWYLKQTAFNKQ